ncbi:MFS transporter [Streptomyces silvensis]|uniref:Major facilitator superfamily (MFS) profile domain-containing protein n=1 Tax=Streptomyces silvensis TaxID=1765722 RepID=A0A0W7WX72_9ACTN|nr:MFS transporter [Streptomyces silvensis]KUF15167.1 hypothetical protein AT728_27360 [Streptomyces silvensis]
MTPEKPGPASATSREDGTTGRRRRFTRLLAATAVSRFGDGLHLTALPLLTATVTPDPTAFAGVTVAQTLPWLLVSLPAGALVDRLDRGRVIAVTNGVQAALAAALAVTVLSGGIGLPVLYAVAFALGCCQTLTESAAAALVPQLVPATALATANGRLTGADIIAGQLLAVPLAGVLFGAVHALPFLVDAATFAAAGLLLTGLGAGRARHPDSEPRASVPKDIAVGVRWLAADPGCRSLALVGALINTVLTGCFATFALFALRLLDVGDAGYGLLMGAVSVGGVVAGLLTGTAWRRGSPRLLLLLSLWVPAVACLSIGLTSSPLLAAAMLALVGFGGTVWTVVTITLRQAVIPAHLQGRVMSVFRLTSAGTAPLGAVLGALLVDSSGLRTPWLVGAGALVLAPLLAGPALRAVPEEASAP